MAVPIPIPELTPYELLHSVKFMAELVAENPEDSSNAKRLADLVCEQVKRERVARVRIGEYFRQRAIQDAQMTERERAASDTSYRNVIDRVNSDQWSKPIALLYSSIETLAPWIEQDTKTAFLAKQQERLEAVLKANPSLTERQVETLRKVATCEKRVYRSMGGSHYGSLDGRVVNGLMKRGLIETHAWGRDFHQSAILIIADQDL
jgi:hypothetical protein